MTLTDGQKEKAVSLGQLKTVEEAAKSYIDAHSGGGGESTVKSISFTLQPNGWANTNSGSYPWRYTISNAKITSDMAPEITFDLSVTEAVAENEIAPVCVADTGVLYIYAGSQPSVNITGVARLIKAVAL